MVRLRAVGADAGRVGPARRPPLLARQIRPRNFAEERYLRERYLYLSARFDPQVQEVLPELAVPPPSPEPGAETEAESGALLPATFHG